MNENRVERTEELNVDVKRLAGAVWNRKWLILLVAILGAVVMGAVTIFMMTPKYQSSAMFYVNNYAQAAEGNASITSSDITASKDLVESYIVILKTRASLEEVIDYSGVDLRYEDLEDMLDASAVNSTEIFEVVVTSTDPQEARKIAEAITVVLPQRIASILDGTSANVVDEPVLAVKPSSPNLILNVMLGFAVGFALCVVVILMVEVFDVTIRSEEDITQAHDLPILATIPDINAPSKGGYYSKKTGQKTDTEKKDVKVGAGVSFAVSEAYKLLRTKVQFSFADENDCHVIGVSSSMAGEGKSTTAANLAYTLAQLDARVLLMDCDLRRPTVPAKLPVAKTPGLTNFLTRQVNIGDAMQLCRLDDVQFYVISAGRIPPNPIELLSSDRMKNLMEMLKQNFDYIIFDLPPISEVSDALVAAKMCDGMLLVVRQNFCNSRVLADCIRQFTFVEARILGFLVSYATDANGGRYGKYGKYGKYKSYYRRYEGSYASAAKNQRKSQENDSRSAQPHTPKNG